MPLNWMTPERAREVRALAFGGPDGDGEIVVSSGLAQAIREHRLKKDAEAMLSGEEPATASAVNPGAEGTRDDHAAN